MQIVSGEALRNDKVLVESFYALAEDTFVLQFKAWADAGFWTSSYKCFAFVDDGKVVANVSGNIVTLFIDGKNVKAVQIGTVMTHPSYRGRGLSRQLMHTLLGHCDEVDLFYLFANSTVLDFYPKFGFEKRVQATYAIDANYLPILPIELQKLSMDHSADRALLYRLAKKRVPISDALAVIQSEDLVLFHALYQYADDLYYNEKLDAAFLYQIDGDVLTIIDIISPKKLDLIEAISCCMDASIKQVRLCFTPDDLSVPVTKGILEDDGALFVRVETDINYPDKVLYPFTSIA